MYVSRGGTATSTTVRSGGILHGTGGTVLRGSNSLGGAMLVSGTVDASGADIVFDVNRRTVSDSYLIENLSLISGATYSITVVADQSFGTYKLAAGATEFAQSITICTTAGVCCDPISVVGSFCADSGVCYSLALNSDVLELTMSGNTPAFKTAANDIDGNGVSDVMFQYTGGDYQIGFWMNGTSEWLGQGQPADWELLDAYEMDGTGKAEAVLRGNVWSHSRYKGGARFPRTPPPEKLVRISE